MPGEELVHTSDSSKTLTLKDDEVWLVNDEQLTQGQEDSTTFGPLRMMQIVGRAIAIKGADGVVRRVENSDLAAELDARVLPYGLKLLSEAKPPERE
jgi:hypothetical protein